MFEVLILNEVALTMKQGMGFDLIVSKFEMVLWRWVWNLLFVYNIIYVM